MRLLLLSDIHANFEALTSVAARARSLSVDGILCLGDIVGYHADVNECVDWIRQHDAICVAGNHDLGCAGVKPASAFPRRARRAVCFGREALSERNRAFLAGLPLFRRVDETFAAVHGALHPEPNCDLHLSTWSRVESSLAWLARSGSGPSICCFGHTHRQVVYERIDGRVVERSGAVIRLRPDAFAMVNPGSVGQSRDRDPRAAFAVLDTTDLTVSFFRVAYDVERCAVRTREAGLIDEEPGQKSIAAALRASARRASTVVRGVGVFGPVRAFVTKRMVPSRHG